MVGIVLVSHSRALAEAVAQLVRSMSGADLPLAIAAGIGNNRMELGTDALEISEAIVSVQGPQGVLVFMDMGSAILSSETALELMEKKARVGVRFCSAPFVEGVVAAAVTAYLGADLQTVEKEAIASLQQKQTALTLPPGASTSVPLVGRSRPSAGVGENRPTPAAASEKALRLVIRNVHGLHARPAARLISETKPFATEITVRNLTNQRGPVPLQSLSSLAGLEILCGHEIEIEAKGRDAAAAVQAIEKLARADFGEDVAPMPTRAGPRNKMSAAGVSTGPIPVSDGVALGPAFYLPQAVFEVPTAQTSDPKETERLLEAIARVQDNLENQRRALSSRVGEAQAEIYRAQSVLLQDAAWVKKAEQLIHEQHQNAALAWNGAMKEIADRYASLSDSYLRERAADVLDVGGQVLEQLGVTRGGATLPTTPFILIADDLTPQQIPGLDRDLVLGVVLLEGGPTSHSAILLRALGIPAVVRARSTLAGADFSTGETIALNGSSGEIWLRPSAHEVEELRSTQREEKARGARERQASGEDGATLDGHRVHVFANLGQVSDAVAAVQAGAEGVGLLRTEFLFLNRAVAPTEEEQVRALTEISAALGDRPLIIRTLDIGGDKTVPYLDLPHEENPFMGVRALRLCLAHGDLFSTQLRAILRAGLNRPFQIMFPMVADVGDLKLARDFLVQVHRQLEQEAVPHLWPIKTGIMIEIPSAALQAEALAEHADFFSIGTNDLTQYALAADRGNTALGDYQDAAHPSVLRLIQQVVQGARQRQRLVAVCGEAASDEFAAALFVGLGVKELSLSVARIPRLKAMLREHSFSDLQHLAERALQCETAREVRRLGVEPFGSLLAE